jgi:hypothetical protein
MSNEVSLPAIRRGDALQVRCRGQLLVAELILCLDPWRRLRGLLGRPPLGEQVGLLLRPCRSVHSFFMGYPIDLAFLDEAGRVVAVRHGLRPWRVSGYVAEACATLELAAGRLERAGTRAGDRLTFLRSTFLRSSS